MSKVRNSLLWTGIQALVVAASLHAQRPATPRIPWDEVVKKCSAAKGEVLKRLTAENACTMTEGELQQMARDLVDIEVKVCQVAPRDIGGYEGILRQTSKNRNQICENQKGGPDSLPPFEAALYAMTDSRQLNPCAYDPGNNYSAIINDPAYQTYNNKTSYNNGITYSRFRLYARKACFLDLIEAFIKGGSWKPPATGPVTLPK